MKLGFSQPSTLHGLRPGRRWAGTHVPDARILALVVRSRHLREQYRRLDPEVRWWNALSQSGAAHIADSSVYSDVSSRGCLPRWACSQWRLHQPFE